MDCIVPVENKKIQTAVTEVGKMPITDFICGMVCCHSLKIVKEKIVGDPLDLKVRPPLHLPTE